MNALALARLDDPLVGSKHALRRSGFPCTLASGLTSLQPSNDVGEKSSSYDEHASGSLFWTQKDPIGFEGSLSDLYQYAGNEPINAADPNGQSICAYICLGSVPCTLVCQALANLGGTVGPVPGAAGGSSNPGAGGGRQNGICYFQRKLTNLMPNCNGSPTTTCQYYCPFTGAYTTLTLPGGYSDVYCPDSIVNAGP